MSGEEAKTVLKGMVSLMMLANMQKPDSTFGTYLSKFDEAVDVACISIDMVEERLDIEGGTKNE